MKCEVQHLANNERYRILMIDGEAYIMDIESSFWKIIFPFLFWLLSNHVEDQTVIERLKTERMKKAGASYLTFATGISYAGGMLLAPLMDYFSVPMSPLINIMLLVLVIILVGLLSFSISRNRKQKLNDVIEIEELPKRKLWIQPSSAGHFFNVLLSYVALLGLSVFFFLGYIETQNVMVLIVASGVLFGVLLINRKTVREGNATVKVKE